VRTFSVDPADLGLPYARLSDLQIGSPAESADVIRRMLGGEPGPARDVVALNAGAALVVAGRADDLRGGIAAAVAAIESGKAAATLDAWVRCSNA
jgi:anthranilate phosphoribosyltransferase